MKPSRKLRVHLRTNPATASSFFGLIFGCTDLASLMVNRGLAIWSFRPRTFVLRMGPRARSPELLISNAAGSRTGEPAVVERSHLSWELPGLPQRQWCPIRKECALYPCSRPNPGWLRAMSSRNS